MSASRLFRGALGASTAALLLLTIAPVQAHKPITSKYSYNADVWPIFRNRCGTCHVPGGVAPMSLLDYKNALPKYEPGEAPDYTSTEGCIAATILIQAPKQTNPPIPSGWSTRWNRCAASISASARHSHLGAQDLGQDLRHCARRERHVPANRT